jgi:hypothetical protein
VHDHGSWGVVGIVQGLLEERAFIAADGEITGIQASACGEAG